MPAGRTPARGSGAVGGPTMRSMLIEAALETLHTVMPLPDDGSTTWHVEAFEVPGWHSAHAVCANGMPLVGGRALVHDDGRILMLSSNPRIAGHDAIVEVLRRRPDSDVAELETLITQQTTAH